MKLMYGPPQMAEYVKNNANIMVVNFNSLKQGFYELNLLPPNALGAVDEYDFDLKYLNYVYSDDYRFCQIYSIPSTIFNAKDVFIIVDYVLHSDWEYNLVESFLKMIQVRYGFNPCSVCTARTFSQTASRASTTFLLPKPASLKSPLFFPWSMVWSL